MQKEDAFPTAQEVLYLTNQRLLENPNLSDSEAQEEVLMELSIISQESLIRSSRRA